MRNLHEYNFKSLQEDTFEIKGDYLRLKYVLEHLQKDRLDNDAFCSLLDSFGLLEQHVGLLGCTVERIDEFVAPFDAQE